MTGAPPKAIKADPLTREGFAPYGDVICALAPSSSASANQGTAQRFNHVARIANLRSDTNPAQPNLCVFRCVPTPSLPFQMKLLERHKYSSQFFVPMTLPQPGSEWNGEKAYLVIVCLNDPVTDRPDYSTLKAFTATSTQGVNYREGCWHHPMIALDRVTDFCVLVHERREHSEVADEDCEEVFLSAENYVDIIVD
ncbi:hypothetical protein HDU85_003537 [Gaertneriomyces sp. JEL0708]|nr:hypothetical protein HDU85_003537 [Gaertneriomyces sp. JEL0708]